MPSPSESNPRLLVEVQDQTVTSDSESTTTASSWKLEVKVLNTAFEDTIIMPLSETLVTNESETWMEEELPYNPCWLESTSVKSSDCKTDSYTFMLCAKPLTEISSAPILHHQASIPILPDSN